MLCYDFQASYDRFESTIRFADDPITAINVTKRTSVGVGGVQTVIADRTFIEEDSTTRTSAMTAFDTANEVKAVIATGISTFNEDTTTNIDYCLPITPTTLKTLAMQ